MPLCFPRVSCLTLGKKELHCNRVNFLSNNNAHWTINQVYRYFAGPGEYYRSYDADKNYRRKCQIYRN